MLILADSRVHRMDQIAQHQRVGSFKLIYLLSLFWRQQRQLGEQHSVIDAVLGVNMQAL